MGTRHLTAVYVDGKPKIAQYGQWDGYPKGQGLKVLEFLRGADLNAFREKVRQTYWLDAKQLDERWAEVGVTGSYATLEQADAFTKKYPENSRDTGAGVLRIVANSDKPVGLENDITFAADSLFCEWGYVVDLDANTFEVYEGFNRKQPEGRFKNISRSDQEFKAITLVATYPLDDLPDKDTLLALDKEEAE